MKNLVAVLEQQMKLLEELQILLQRETNELSDVHLDAMVEINLQKEDIATRIAAHAAKLRIALEEVASREGLSSRAALGELAASLNKKGNREIARFHAELNATADQIKELLSLNKDIAERFAASVGNSLDFIARIINQTSTYGASGSYQQRPVGAVLINREA
jgi:flagellar biosynthesis/type III secretory pathway chaperone